MMIYPMAARTMKKAEERDNFYDGGMPYLNAPNYIHGGYISSTWAEDDRRFLMMIKISFVAAIGGLICIIAMMFSK